MIEEMATLLEAEHPEVSVVISLPYVKVDERTHEKTH